MKIDELTPKPTDKVLFKLASSNAVPNECGCYVLASFENDILYIGLASKLNNRFKQHLDSPEKTSPTLEGKAIWFHFAIFDSKNLPKLERTWLNLFSSKHGRLPILNKVNSPIN